MNEQQAELARHALGLTDGRKVSYRNHYVTGAGGPDHADWIAMVKAGEARHRAGTALTGGDDLFWLTEVGARAALKRGQRLDPEDFPPSALTSAESPGDHE